MPTELDEQELKCLGKMNSLKLELIALPKRKMKPSSQIHQLVVDGGPLIK
jgi:hypothetical protein